MAAITTVAISEAETPLLNGVVQGSVDFKGGPTVRSKSGCWKAASLIIGVEMVMMFAHYGIRSNLVSYLTGPLGQSTATAAANVNTWSGAVLLSPLLGAYIADSYLGKYQTIIISTLLYILGLGFLSLSAALYSSNSLTCQNAINNTACAHPQLQITFFFFSLYLVALAKGGNTPCLPAFGADQFDEDDQEERKAKSSFFNWWNFCSCASILVALLVLSYIQENMSWALGFGIPCVLACFALFVFVLGSMTYRFRINTDERSRIVGICRVAPKVLDIENEAQQVVSHEDAHFRFLDKPLLEADGGFIDKSLHEVDGGPKDIETDCNVGDIEDPKTTIIKLLPICLTCLPYAIVIAQSSTLFTKQGATMDRYLTTTFQIPTAAFQSLAFVYVVISIPFYDWVLVPISRAISRKPSGISLLQRIGFGIFLSTISMVMSGFIERKRIATAIDYGLVDSPNAIIPMSVWWLAPQYLLLGIADVFTMIGLQEFVYDRVSSKSKSMGLALYSGVIGSGSFLSGFLIYVIEKVTSGHGREGWFANNLNRAHFDYFYWLLAGLNAFSLVLFICFAKSYT